ncbi:hypothetical protein DFO70_105276 [Cytobacillus firmus]|uniref:Uncharacterized protein n=2 Tax=Cytobacillus TaxID=2675230 RepID=A0A366JX69_CYTFI|nr:MULTISPECIES: hypothetical protein [Cytobacillus]RBP94034.1 hypothetical protein DFO70_105276 [Cytobacillus firmus]TDX47552.1 hypothetical protein DFO72_101655 [Cytobacillus oceanisediminis]
MEKKIRSSLLNLHGVKRHKQPQQDYEFSEELADGGERSERFNKPRYNGR